MLERLKEVPLFQGLPEDILRHLAELSKEERYREGETIFSEGSVGDALFIVGSGEVLINKVIDREERTFMTLAILGKDDFFGEMSLIDQEPRSASAVAKGDVSLFRLERRDFEALFRRDPQASVDHLFTLLRTMTRRLRQTDNELVTLYETGKIAGQERDLNLLSELILERVMRAIGSAESGLLAIWNEFNEEFEVQAMHGYDIPEARIEADEPIVKWLVENKERLVVKNLSRDRRFPDIGQRFYHGTSILASPFLQLDEILGFIILTNRTKEGVFSSDQVNMLSGVTAQVAGAIENVRHLQEEDARKRLARMRAKG